MTREDMTGREKKNQTSPLSSCLLRSPLLSFPLLSSPLLSSPLSSSPARQSCRQVPRPRAQRHSRDILPTTVTSRVVSARSLPLRFAMRAAMHRASCVSSPLRSAKRPLQAYLHKSTASVRLPRLLCNVRACSHSRFLAQGR